VLLAADTDSADTDSAHSSSNSCGECWASSAHIYTMLIIVYSYLIAANSNTDTKRLFLPFEYADIM
jgi:hypothetical protein